VAAALVFRLRQIGSARRVRRFAPSGLIGREGLPTRPISAVINESGAPGDPSRAFEPAQMAR